MLVSQLNADSETAKRHQWIKGTISVQNNQEARIRWDQAVITKSRQSNVKTSSFINTTKS